MTEEAVAGTVSMAVMDISIQAVVAMGADRICCSSVPQFMTLEAA